MYLVLRRRRYGVRDVCELEIGITRRGSERCDRLSREQHQAALSEPAPCRGVGGLWDPGTASRGESRGQFLLKTPYVVIRGPRCVARAGRGACYLHSLDSRPGETRGPCLNADASPHGHSPSALFPGRPLAQVLVFRSLLFSPVAGVGADDVGAFILPSRMETFRAGGTPAW